MASKRLGWDVWRHVFEDTSGGKPYVHLERSSTDGVCFCECPRALVAVPDQRDCPWCGCGWLFCCAQCGRAFTYARPVVVHRPLRQIVEQDMLARGWKSDAEQFDNATEYLSGLLEMIEGEGEHVYLDGAVLPLEDQNIEFEGLYANHQIDVLPHAGERGDPGSLVAMLGEVKYWTDRERNARK